MAANRSSRRWFSALLVLVLLGSPILSPFAAADQGKHVGPSGATAKERGITLGAEGPVTAPSETFGEEGGIDIPLGGTNEPTIAVNPLNTANIAVANLFTLRVSTNTGATFSAGTAAVVPATHTMAGDPSLAFDSQGRLFWTYLGQRTDNGNLDVFVAQANPTTGAILAGYPVNVTAGAGLPASAAGNCHDKEWLAADRFPGSPFQDQLYVVWTRFTGAACTGPTVVHTTFSANQGLTWSVALTVSVAAEGFVWPSHNAVAPNGDVYVAYHSQPTFTGNNPDGITGQVFVLRSTDGGGSYPQKTTAYTAGNADITFNVQTAPATRTLNGSASWAQGSAQAWVLPDPINPNNVYVIAADDPTNTQHGVGFDDANVYLVRSTNQGVAWGAPVQMNGGPVGTTQFFPTAAIADGSQCLVVTWYDTRANATNAGGNFLLDLFLRASPDGGLTFGPEIQINDVPFDPDLGAPTRFAGPPATLRIGEYNGVAVADGIAHAVWTGNTAAGQQTLFDSVVTRICPIPVALDIRPQSCPNPLNVNSKGVLPVAILGTATFDVTQVDVATVRLEGVSPLRSSLEDVTAPFVPFTGKRQATDCTEAGPDGFQDLTLKFDTQAVVAALGPVTDQEVLAFKLTGQLLDGTPIVGEDVVKILKKK